MFFKWHIMLLRGKTNWSGWCGEGKITLLAFLCEYRVSERWLRMCETNYAVTDPLRTMQTIEGVKLRYLSYSIPIKGIGLLFSCIHTALSSPCHLLFYSWLLSYMHLFDVRLIQPNYHPRLPFVCSDSDYRPCFLLVIAFCKYTQLVCHFTLKLHMLFVLLKLRNL